MRQFAYMALLLPLFACGSVKENQPDAASGTPDATADAPPGTPDAMPGAPDAMPGAADAMPGTPDAMPGTPDAMTCTHCYALIMGMGDPANVCPGSMDLYIAWVTCICDPTNCGDTECPMSCTGMGMEDPMICGDCVNMVSMPGGACSMQVNACLADM